jgi:hypothetical protein
MDHSHMAYALRAGTEATFATQTTLSVQMGEKMPGTVTLRCGDEVPCIHLHTTCTVALLDAPSPYNPCQSVGRLDCC